MRATLANAVQWEFVSLETVAAKWALGVDTATTAAHRLVQALVYIWGQKESETGHSFYEKGILGFIMPKLHCLKQSVINFHLHYLLR